MKEKYVKELQNCGMMFFIAATGGGTSFTGEFLKISGGSKCITGGHICYAMEATDQFISGKLDKYADANAARKLAVAAYEQCVNYKIKPDMDCVGIGIACSLVKDNERDGRKHYINIAIHTFKETFGTSIIIHNGIQNRLEEENFVNDLTLYLLSKKYLKDIDPNWKTEHVKYLTDNNAEMNEFYAYNRMAGCVQLYCDAIEHVKKQKTLVIYPGSFNPLHESHADIYYLSHKITELPVFYEMSVTNSYKPAMDNVDLENRYSQFKNNEWRNSVILTKAPRFVDKVKLLKLYFPEIEQIIISLGADVWDRVFDEAAHKNGDIKFFEENNVKFLVFGRGVNPIKYQDSNLLIKNDLAMNYKKDISSTAIRNKQANI